MSDDVLDQADRLMRRHRVFVADGAEHPASPGPAEDEDVPVLTEVVSLDEQALGASSAPDTSVYAETLATELEAWLDLELPGHVMHAMDGVTDQVILQVVRRARAELLPRLLTALEQRRSRDGTGG